jgi:phage-related protein
MKKEVFFNSKAHKEFMKFPENVRAEFYSYIEELELTGKLSEPEGKKLSGYRNLFEIRVRREGAWRVLYSYVGTNEIILLAAFQKKSYSTSKSELKKATSRLAYHINY